MPVFMKTLLPYFNPIQDEYKEFLEVLKKIGVKNIEHYIGLLVGNTEETQNTVEKKLGKSIEQVANRNNVYEMPIDKALEMIGKALSFDNTFPVVSEMTENKWEEHLKHLDSQVEKLTEKEQAQYKSFNLLIMKVWVSYVVNNPVSPHLAYKTYIKEFSQKYYTRMNEFYEKEIIPGKLIDYIKGIELPEVEEVEEVEEEKLENKKLFNINTTIPVFTEMGKIYEVLKRYFDAAQYEALLKVLQTGITHDKLVFKGNGNQLADAFKRLYTATLLTGLTKDELTKWILNCFAYKNWEGNPVLYTKHYLSTIISSEKNPCKSPIIEIKKEENGNISIFSPDQKGRNQH